MTAQPDPLTPRPFQLEAFQRLFLPEAWQAGRRLKQEGEVLACRVQGMGTVLGKVRDVVEVHDVAASLNPQGFHGFCSCLRDEKVERFCRHMVALLIHHAEPPVLLQFRPPELTDADRRHLDQMGLDWVSRGSMHSVQLEKLRVMVQRCPGGVEEHLRSRGWGRLWEESREAPVVEESAVQLVPKPVLPPAPPATGISTPWELVFVLDLESPIRLRPMMGKVLGTALHEPAKLNPWDPRILLSSREQGWMKQVQSSKADRNLKFSQGVDALLRALLKAGRLYLQGHWDHPLTLGAERTLELAYLENEQGTLQHPVARVSTPARLLVLESLWFLDTLAWQMGGVTTGFHPREVSTFLGIGPVGPEQVEQVQKKLTQYSQGRLPAPREVPFVEVPAPLNCLLHITARPEDRGHKASMTVVLRYGEVEIQQGLPTWTGNIAAHPPLRHKKEGVVQVIRRDVRAERKALLHLQQLGFTPGKVDETLHCYYGAPGRILSEGRWQELVETVLPRLRQDGWQVEIDEKFPFRMVQVDPELRVEEGNGWFSLELLVEVDGEKVSLLPLLMRWMQNHPQEVTLLLDGTAGEQVEFIALSSFRCLKLDLARLRKLLRLLREYYTPANPTRVKLPRLAAPDLLDLADLNEVRWTGQRDLFKLGETLRGLETQPTALEVPAALQATLRPYQSEGVQWLQMLRETRCNGILADDMGLGKTLQTLTHILIEKVAGRLTRPVLVVAPTSLMSNWVSEARKFTPTLETLLLHGQGRRHQFGKIGDVDVVFTTYSLLSRDLKVHQDQPYHTIILDEAQNIKNHLSKASQALTHLNAEHRLCLSGTPLENHLLELWSLFRFLMPGLLGSAQQFTSLFQDQGRGEQLLKLLRPLMLRRTKGQVARDLPEKTEITVRLDLEGDQRDVYETLRVATLQMLQEEVQKKHLAQTRMHALAALMRLRQACCHPKLLSLPEARKIKTSVKLQWLQDTLPGMLEEGRSVLIFSQFTSLLALLGTSLQENGIPYALLTGQTLDRAAQVERFQSGEVKVFLVSLKAGGVGLNLTAADTVIHFDPWWNPAAENQATDRAHRIGQDKPVFVYKLITSGTIEERILEMQKQKLALANSVLEDGLGEGLQFTEQDLQHLLGV